jgi:hypothetical protein
LQHKEEEEDTVAVGTADPADTADLADPVDPADTADPADPANPADMTDPADTAVPANLADPAARPATIMIRVRARVRRGERARVS